MDNKQPTVKVRGRKKFCELCEVRVYQRSPYCQECRRAWYTLKAYLFRLFYKETNHASKPTYKSEKQCVSCDNKVYLRKRTCSRCYGIVSRMYLYGVKREESEAYIKKTGLIPYYRMDYRGLARFMKKNII